MKNKICYIIGTRPELIRLSNIIKVSKEYYDISILWTNQNYDKNLSEIFIKEFNIKPTLINKAGLYGIEFISTNIKNVYDELIAIRPDLCIVLGDTHSVFSSTYVAKRLGIKVMHLEAGNRCFDVENVPEEFNRRIIDRMSDVNLCYTEFARRNLIKEGYEEKNIHVIGDPIVEVLKSNINIDKYNKRKNKYLCTLHRKENMNGYLEEIFEELNTLDSRVEVIMHPTMMVEINKNLILMNEYKNIDFIKPIGYNDFLKKIYNAKCLITDSGSIPSEALVLKTPCVLFRDSTERQELLENNSMVMCKHYDEIKASIKIAINNINGKLIPREYHEEVTSNVIKLIQRYI